jgi:DNA repair exonuclease SbcCD nuclease subunit
MLIPILGDTHFGARGNSQFFLDNAIDFFENVFFPYMVENELKTFIQVGDLMESRKTVGILAHNALRVHFLERCEELQIRGYFLPGNHDILHNNTSEFNWLNELIPPEKYPTAVVIQEPTTIKFDGVAFDFMPWINKENETTSLAYIQQSASPVNIGHYDIIGFEMQKGVDCHSGFDKKTFKNYKLVLSGHYHNFQEGGNITYTGCPYQFNWSDFNVRKGFLVLDTASLKYEYVENPKVIFHKVLYNDTETDYTTVNIEEFEGAFVKVIVEEKTNDDMFDNFIAKLEEIAYEVDPVDTRQLLADDDDVELQVDDTRTILMRSVDGFETNLDRDRIKSRLSDIFTEAEEMMVV